MTDYQDVVACRAGARSNGKKYIRFAFKAAAAALLWICASIWPAGPAYAQQAAVATADSADTIEEVVVTGSRVITNGNNSPTPVTVLSTEQLELMNPGPVTQALTVLPSLLGTPNQGGQGPNPQAVINLRGLGGQRDLILFDGHRVAPTTNAEGVDSNLIPTMLLKRVDIVTGGASAVYGSDAVSGVVNYIVDNEFNGVKVVGQAGESTYRDDKTENGGIAFGTPLFGGRGHFEASFQLFNDPGVSNRFDREWGRDLYSMQGSVPGSAASAGSPANPWALYANTRLSVTSFGGLINSGPLKGLNFTQNGVLSPFVNGVPTGSPSAQIGGDGGYYTTVSAFARQNMDQGFARFDYDLTDNTKAYVELSATTVLYTYHSANAEVRTKAIGYNNAFLDGIQPAYQTELAAAEATDPTGSFNFSRILTGDQFPSPEVELRTNQYLLLAGVNGSWGDYKWSVGYEYSDAITTQFEDNNLSNPRLYAAMNAVINPANNQVVCNAALVNPAVYGNCVPLNLFGPSASSKAAFNYIMLDNEFSNVYTMNDLDFSVTGAPFSTWAGKVGMAVSGEVRRLTYEVNSNALPSDPVDCTGIQFNCNSGTSPYFATVSADFPKTHQDVEELAYEAELPLLKDVFLGKSLALNTAARFTNYQVSGSVWTWKLGLTWAPNDDLTVRVARSRDIRAPGLIDLFQPPTITVTNITDLHTGVTGNVNQVTEGNPNLTPEKADTLTVGFVLTPSFAEGLSLSMDYYHININNALNAIAARQPATMLACENSGGTSPVCDLYVRPFPFSNTTAANFPTELINQTLNTAELWAEGVDTELGYTHRIFGHNFSARALVNFQPHLVYNLGSAGTLDVGGAADGIGGLPPTPNVKGVLQSSYEVMPDLTFSAQERYRNALKQNGSPVIFIATGELPPAMYTDLTLTYKHQLPAGNLETYFNVRNVFDKQPPPWASTGGNSQIGSFGGWAQGDDPLGRYFTVGFRYKL
jgi:iron complex outermembrane receptor protein